MKFRYNIFNFVTSICFVLAFLSLMFSYLTYIMFYPAMAFFAAGFVLLSVRLVKNYISNKGQIEEQTEAIEMELASGEDGETYVMKAEKNDKKARRRMRSLSFQKILPSLLSIFASGIFIFLLVSSIIAGIWFIASSNQNSYQGCFFFFLPFFHKIFVINVKTNCNNIFCVL